MTDQQAEKFLVVLNRIADALEKTTKKQTEAPREFSHSGGPSQKQLSFIRELRVKLADSSTEEPQTSADASALIKTLIERRDKAASRPRRATEPEPEDRSDIDPERNARMIAEHMEKMGWN